MNYSNRLKVFKKRNLKSLIIVILVYFTTLIAVQLKYSYDKKQAQIEFIKEKDLFLENIQNNLTEKISVNKVNDQLFLESKLSQTLYEVFLLRLLFVNSIFISFLFLFWKFKSQIHKLESEVIQRNENLETEKDKIKLIINNVSQGFMLFGRDGLIENTFSMVCYDFFRTSPSGKKLSNCLELDPNFIDEIIPLMFDEIISFKSLTALLPSEIAIGQKVIHLQFKPIRSKFKSIQKIMCVLTDVTDQKLIEDSYKKEISEYVGVVRILKQPNEVHGCYELINQLEENTNNSDSFVRILHTLKGNFGYLGLNYLVKSCHQYEEDIRLQFSQRKAEDISDSIKYKLDAFIDRYNDVLKIHKISQKVYVEVNQLDQILFNLDNQVKNSEIYNQINNLKNQPLDEILFWMNDAFRSTADIYEKTVSPIEFKRSIHLNGNLYSKLFKTFVHIARNSADHGLENEEEKELVGKTEPGKLEIDSWEENEFYYISFKDNGRGIDLEKIRAKAARKNIKVTNTDQDLNLIFESEFTSKEHLTQTSGRGIGLYAVKFEVMELGGDFKIINQPGFGLEIIISFKKIINQLQSKKISA